MGQGQSTSLTNLDGNNNEEIKPLQMFKKEADYMNELLSLIMSNNRRFHDEELNFLDNSVCDNFVFILESNLNKHLKVEVRELSENLLLIPKGQTEFLKKEQLCQLVTRHYRSIFEIIQLIKEVYDTDNFGNNSLLGICSQLIYMDDNNNRMIINFCSGIHREEDPSFQPQFIIDTQKSKKQPRSNSKVRSKRNANTQTRSKSRSNSKFYQPPEINLQTSNIFGKMEKEDKTDSDEFKFAQENLEQDNENRLANDDDQKISQEDEKNNSQNKGMFSRLFGWGGQKGGNISKMNQTNSVDLAELKGFSLLFEKFLNDIERAVVMNNFRQILSSRDTTFSFYNKRNHDNAQHLNANAMKTIRKRNRQAFIDAVMCGDALLSQEEYVQIFTSDARSRSCNKVAAFNRENEIQQEKLKGTISTRVQIDPYNPIFAPYCTDKKMIVIDMNQIKKEDATKLKTMFDELQNDYKLNMEFLHGIMKNVIVYDKNKKLYTLVDLTSIQVEELKDKVKKIIVQFYFKSLINYQNLLDFALSLIQ